MKYKVGDKVRIKSLDWYNRNKNEHGYVLCGEYYFVPRMSVFCGKILTIDVDFEDGTYLVEEDIDGFIFTDEMIECKVEEEVSYDTESEWLKHEISLPDGYIFKDENGNVINAKKIVLEKKKKEYPKTYEIWSEGYIVTGGSGTAYLHGKIKANSLKEACDILFDDDKFYNPKNLTYWGCKLFDNETDARKSFG